MQKVNNLTLQLSIGNIRYMLTVNSLLITMSATPPNMLV
jgi:hypothetical protein